MNVSRLVMTAVLVVLVAAGAATWAGAGRPGAALRGERARARAELVRVEDATPAGTSGVDAAWRLHVALVDQALGRGDVSTAVRAWHDAYGAAMGSRDWAAMLEVGDAFHRIGDVAHSREGAKPNARQAYLVGLVRAWRAESVTGVLRAAQSFAALGDREVASAALGIADRLARAQADDGARARVQALATAVVPPRAPRATP